MVVPVTFRKMVYLSLVIFTDYLFVGWLCHYYALIVQILSLVNEFQILEIILYIPLFIPIFTNQMFYQVIFETFPFIYL